MGHFRRRMVLALCLAIAGCTGFDRESTSEAPLSASEALTVVREFDDAWLRKDTAVVASLLADEFAYFSSTGGVRSREWLLDDLLGHPEYDLDRAVRGELDVILHGSTAVVSSRWRGAGSYAGEPVDDDQRCSVVVVRQGSATRIIMEHCTQIAP
jgi:ketosteroid isomerase-like protein